MKYLIIITAFNNDNNKNVMKRWTRKVGLRSGTHLIIRWAVSSCCSGCLEVRFPAAAHVYFLLNSNYHLVIVHLIVAMIVMLAYYLRSLGLSALYSCYYRHYRPRCYWWCCNFFAIVKEADYSPGCNQHTVRSRYYSALISFASVLGHRCSLPSTCRTEWETHIQFSDWHFSHGWGCLH